jgi:hypothetical protein
METTTMTLTQSKSQGKASTNNWDTAFAINFLNANNAIKLKKSSPKKFSGTKPGGGFSGPAIDVAGDFGDWQLSGGSGSIAELILPINGKATSEGDKPITIPFKGEALISIELQFLPQSNSAEATPVDKGGTTNNLKPNLTTDDPETKPVVSIIDVTLNKEAAQAKDAVHDVLEKWLLANLESFNHTFAAIDLGAVADKDQFQWLAPTKLGYGISNPEGAKVDDYIFAVMAMTEKRAGVNLGHNVSPNIIPENCNSGFLISQERFMTKIMMPGMKLMFLNAQDSDFEVTGDGSTITNTNALTFHDFTTESKSGDTVDITGATIDKGKFQIIANATTLAISFIDLNFPWDGGGYTVHLNYNGESELYMDKNKHFQAKTIGKPSLAVNVTESSGEKWAEIIIGIVEGIAFAVAGAMIGGALGPAAGEAGEGMEQAGSDAAEGVEGSTNDLNFSGDFPSDDDISNLDEVNSDDESESSDEMENADNSSYKTKFKGFFRRNWRKMLGMAVGGVVGVVVDKIPTILEAYSEKDLANMPTLDEFVDYSVSATTWPGQTGYTLESVSLNESLQMGLNVNVPSK